MITEYIVYERTMEVIGKAPRKSLRPHLTKLCTVNAVDETAAIEYAAELLGLPQRILRAVEEQKAEPEPKVLREVYVIMGNDYPAAVFTSSEEADKYIESRSNLSQHDPPTRIHWTHYKFILKEKADD